MVSYLSPCLPSQAFMPLLSPASSLRDPFTFTKADADSASFPSRSSFPPSPPFSPEVVTLSRAAFVSSPPTLRTELEGGGRDVDALDWTPTALDTLDLDDREQMNALMTLTCSRVAADFAAEVASIVIPVPWKVGKPRWKRDAAVKAQEEETARLLLRLTSCVPHPFVTLVYTIILLERLASLYPSLGAGSLTDTSSRVVFTTFLLAAKLTSDLILVNSSFVPISGWSLLDINRMERELLSLLCWDLYINPSELLHRAQGFWSVHLSSTRRIIGADDGLPAFIPELAGNLFLRQSRAGIDEQASGRDLWRGGLVSDPGERGRRIAADPVASSPSPCAPPLVVARDSSTPRAGPPSIRKERRVRVSTVPGVGVGPGGFAGLPRKGVGDKTVWRRGRLERTGPEDNEAVMRPTRME